MKLISVLRGINVSGKNKILMKDLKILYEELGFTNIITYIQSGNVIFDCKDYNKKLSQKIENAIEKKYHFFVPVEIRTGKEIAIIIKNCPFKPVDLDKSGTNILLTFLNKVPSNDDIETLLTFVKSPEKLIQKEKVIYLFCPNGYGKSKLSNVFLEKKLKVKATTRNWKTMVKLEELINQNG